MRDKQTLGLIIYGIILAVLASLSAYYFLPHSLPSRQYGNETAFVIRVIDGDTFVVDSGKTVRLICVDSPEMGKTGAKEAKAFLEGLIANKTVRLERDIDDSDRYGRILRYVYANETFVNRAIVQAKQGSVFRYGNNTAKCADLG